MDTTALIAAIKCRKELWDKSHFNYQNRALKPHLWNEVAGQVGCSVSDAKRKWSNLRDQYRVEIKRMHNTKDVCKPYVSSWAYLESLSFIKDHLYTLDTSSSMWKRSTQSEVIDPQVEVETEWTEEDTKPTPEQLRKCLAEEPLQAKGMKRERDEYSSSDFELDCTDNDTEWFLKSLIPALKSLPYPRQLFVRAKIQSVIAEEISKTYLDTNNSSAGPGREN